MVSKSPPTPPAASGHAPAPDPDPARTSARTGGRSLGRAAERTRTRPGLQALGPRGRRHATRPSRRVSIAAAAALAAAAIAPQSCAPAPRPDLGRSSHGPTAAGLAAPPTTASIRADWDDVDAAVDAALSRCAAAAERRDADADDPRDTTRIEYRLVTLRGDTGTLIVDRDPGADPARPLRVSLACSIGPLGNPSAEACVVESAAHRLRQLRGVDFAPIRW